MASKTPSTATIAGSASDEAAAIPRITAIPSNNITMDVGGFSRRYFSVRLPKGMTMDDAREPRAWRTVQGGRNALRKHDALYVIDFDDSAAFEAVVTEVTDQGVTIHPSKVVSFPAPAPLMSTEDYDIQWTGLGYQIRRKSDGHFMTQAVSSKEIAIKDLQSMYQRRS